MAERSPRVFTVTIEPVGGCNLACRYCYARHSGESMTEKVLAAALREVLRYAGGHGFGEIDFIWHGGEPLLAGLPFYKTALALLAEGPAWIRRRHFLQTNALLADEEFCRLFREAGFQVGVSLDGPRQLHDRARVGPEGGGTHAKVLEKVRLFRAHALPVGFCAVVTRASIGEEESIYRFFQELGGGFRVNPLLPSPTCGRDDLLSPGEYGSFLCRLFDLWTAPPARRVPVSPLDGYLRALITGSSRECQHGGCGLGSRLGIKPNGDVVLCGRFQALPLGNLLETPIDELFAGDFCSELALREKGLVSCRRCPEVAICRGGCPHNALALAGDLFKRDPFCADYRMVFSHLRAALRQATPLGKAGASDEKLAF